MTKHKSNAGPTYTVERLKELIAEQNVRLLRAERRTKRENILDAISFYKAKLRELEAAE